MSNARWSILSVTNTSVLSEKKGGVFWSQAYTLSATLASVTIVWIVPEWHVQFNPDWWIVCSVWMLMLKLILVYAQSTFYRYYSFSSSCSECIPHFPNTESILDFDISQPVCFITDNKLMLPLLELTRLSCSFLVQQKHHYCNRAQQHPSGGIVKSQ